MNPKLKRTLLLAVCFWWFWTFAVLATFWMGGWNFQRGEFGLMVAIMILFLGPIIAWVLAKDL